MGAEAGSCSRRIGLYCIALIEVTLLVKLTEQPPHRFDITVVVGDIGVIHIDPVTHGVGKIFPLLGVLHHFATTSGIIVIYRNLLSDIFLGYSECFLHAELYG